MYILGGLTLFATLANIAGGNVEWKFESLLTVIVGLKLPRPNLRIMYFLLYFFLS